MGTVIGIDLGTSTTEAAVICDGKPVMVLNPEKEIITPSAVGGSALAVFYLNREGVSVGRATTLTLTTLLLDELFFVVFCPLLFVLLPSDALFGSGGNDLFLDSVQIAFWMVYSGIVAYTVLLFCGILLWPHKVELLLNRLFSLRPLRRWRTSVARTGHNIVETSAWIRSCSAVGGSTCSAPPWCRGSRAIW